MRIGILLAAASLSAALHPGRMLAPAVRAGRMAAGVRCQVSELPRGWKEVTDEESGKNYYNNVASGETQWQRPEASEFTGAGDGGARLLTPACTWRVKMDLYVHARIEPAEMPPAFGPRADTRPQPTRRAGPLRAARRP